MLQGADRLSSVLGTFWGAPELAVRTCLLDSCDTHKMLSLRQPAELATCLLLLYCLLNFNKTVSKKAIRNASYDFISIHVI